MIISRLCRYVIRELVDLYPILLFFCLFVCFITLSLLFPLKIITDGRDINAVDNDGCQLPTMVYMSREKKPQQPHNFKAGALNALVSFSFLYFQLHC